MKILKIIKQIKANKDRPRDPETGQWISKEDPLGHYKSQNAPTDYVDPLDNFHDADEPLGKATETPRQLPEAAGHIQRQSQAFLHHTGGATPRARHRIADAGPLYLSYKMHAHNPSAQLLRYVIHRIENKGQYDHPERAAASDAKFEQAFARWRPDSKKKSLSANDLHHIVLASPHLVDQVLEHKQKLHDYLRANGKTKMIAGEESVPLLRELPNAHVPEGITTSYSDRPHPAGLWGARPHSYHMPLANVWYSYDHGPRAAVHHRFPAQDEYLVSPHPMRPAGGHEVKKLVPANLHQADQDKQQEMRLTASMTDEFNRLAKSLSFLD